MQSSTALFVLVLVTMASAGPQPQGGSYPTRPPRQHLCSTEKDCPDYHFCFYSYWFGSKCNSHLDGSGASCVATKGGRTVPSHEMCRDGDFSVRRCFPELGYECRNAFYMPCTPEFDDEGRVTTEDGCPERFKCTRVEFEAGPEKVCVPVQPKEFRAEKCETDFDCGYSVLEGGWSPCGGGRCYRAVEK